MLIHTRVAVSHRPRRQARGRSAVRWVGALAAMAALPLAAQNGGGTPRLNLAREAELRLPDSLVVAGAMLSESGRLMTWSGTGPALTVVSPEGLQTLGERFLVRPVAAALLDGDSVVSALDLSDTVRVVRLSRSGRLLGEAPVALPFTPESAVRAGGGWVVAGRDSADDLWIAAVTDAGQVSGARGLPLKRPADRSLYTTGLAACGATLYVATRIAPLRLLRVDPDGSVRDLLTAGILAELPGDSLSAGRDTYWGAAPPTCLDAGVAITLVDQRSDTRVLLRFDERGALARAAPLTLPLAFIASAPVSRRMVALRRLNSTEVVWYRWRWGDPEP